MDLDMYAYKARLEDTTQLHPDVRWVDDFDKDSHWYWRKFNALHDWMENIYVAKGGKKTFNLVKLYLTKEDLNQLLEDCNAGRIEPTPDFFFDSQHSMTEEEKEEIRSFVSEALKAIDEGFIIVYDSWW